MNVRRYATAAEILPDVQAFLEQEEGVADLPLGILTRLATNPAPADSENRPYYALLSDQGRPALLMMRTPPHNMILHANAPEGDQGDPLEATYKAGIAFLHHQGLTYPGVIGPRDVVTGFADVWSKTTGGTWQIQMEQMIYRLDRVQDVPVSPGKLIQAGQKDLDMLTEWLLGFSEATPETIDADQARTSTQERIDAGRIYLWRDQQPVSMAFRSRPAGHGITVTGVYTPPEYRRRGYATSCVASLSRLLLAEGYRYCTLYTDLANPTSNSIYQKIGYRPVRASAMVECIP
jgi:ribosomal protein S18 acetylase RimI-like enzyme